MAEKKAQIVIKKITIVQGGAHGGAWKVAFADFMTAMMAFFLVMWLLATQSPAEKKAISDYFSTPSVIEYQFNNYGVEITLEKLFLDLINEPLKVFQAFVTPADRTPNVMAMGMKKVVMAHMAEQLGNYASDVTVTAESIVFDIPDTELFQRGSSLPSAMFVGVMDRVKGVTTGLEDSDIVVTSIVYDSSIEGQNMVAARKVAEERLDMIYTKVKSGLEHDSVSISGKFQARREDRNGKERKGSGGFIRLEVKQKKVTADGRTPRVIREGGVFSKPAEATPEADKSDYDAFVSRVAKKKQRQ